MVLVNFAKKIIKSVVPHKFQRGLPTSRDFLLKRMPQGSICAEIGVYEGDFSTRILNIVKPKKLHLIDTWQITVGKEYENSPLVLEKDQNKMEERYKLVKEKFVSFIEQGVVEIHRGNSDDVLNNFKKNYFDWVYIDANHSYKFVKNDLESTFPKVKSGGFIVGDDYGYDGQWWQENTTKAVDEFIEKQSITNAQIKNHQYILQK